MTIQSKQSKQSTKTKTAEKIVVLGAGNFGTCLAHHLASSGHQVILWARDARIVDAINHEHKNPKYLSDIRLHPSVRASNTITSELFDDTTAVLFATSTQSLREVLRVAKLFLRPSHILIGAMKGIDIESQDLPHDVFKAECGAHIEEQLAFLSGPTFASEIAQKLPTAIVAASVNEDVAKKVQALFHQPFFRVYTSDDPHGLELAGALKNVIAIATGACAGLNFQDNARAALMTRGLAEMMRIGVAFGAKPLTYLGLGGVGDLFLTCSSEKSRNFNFGRMIGAGLSVEKALRSIGSVAEGYYTARPAYELALKKGVDAPIIKMVYAVLYEGKPIRDAVKELTEREAKAEFPAEYQ